MIDGELVVTPLRRIPMHQIVSMNIESALDRHVRDGGLGRVLHAPGRHSPHSGQRPDPRHHLHRPRPAPHHRPEDHRRCSRSRRGDPLAENTRGAISTIKRALYARFGVAGILDRRPGHASYVLALAGRQGFEPVPSGEGGAITSRVLPGLTTRVERRICRCRAVTMRSATPASALIPTPLPARWERGFLHSREE